MLSIAFIIWHSYRKDKKNLRRDRSRPVRMRRNNRIECIEIIRQVLGLHSIHSINRQVTTCPYTKCCKNEERRRRNQNSQTDINKRRLNHG